QHFSAGAPNEGQAKRSESRKNRDRGKSLMAVRDFLDESGTKWRVWPVLRSSIHPKTAAEDYLGDYGDGWLCFESASERRRLARFPEDWDKMPDGDSCKLLSK